MTLLRLVNTRRTQAVLTIFWLAMCPTAYLAGWLKSVTFVSALSLWALVASHGAWCAAAGAAEESVGEEVVEAVVERTNVQPE